MNDVSFETINYRIDDGIARLGMNRPDVYNALNVQMYGELKQAVRLADADDDVSVIVIYGEGTSFSTGGDLTEAIDNLLGDDPVSLYKYEDASPFGTIFDAGKPVIAQVSGHCLAGGLIIALACDLILSDETGRFGVPEAKIGLTEPWIPALLFGQVPITKLKYLAYAGRSITAREADRLGMITEVVEGDLAERVTEVAEQIKSVSLAAVKAYKQMINRQIHRESMSGSYETWRTPEVREGLLGFASRKR